MSRFITLILGQYKPDNNQEQQQCVCSGVNVLAFKEG